MDTNGQRQKLPRTRSLRRNATLYVLLAAICTVLAALGLGAVGPWYITLGSFVLAVASGLSLNRAERTLNSRTGIPRALAAVAFGLILMIMFYSADNQLLFIAASVGTLFTVILAVISLVAVRRSSAGPTSSRSETSNG